MRSHTRRTLEGRRLWSAGHALIVGVIVLVLATLLNAAHLLETAQRQPIGSQTRAIAVGVMEPVAALSDSLYLDRPRQLLDELLGKASPDSSPTTNPEQTDTTVTTDPAPSSSTTAVAPSVTPTESDPMVLWLIGDSFLELFGPALQNDAFATGVVTSEVDFRFISGLIRPDYFDWPAHARQRMPELQPDAVLVMFGGNDGQAIIVEDARLEPDTPEWIAVYRRLIGEMMDLLLEEGASDVYWVGLPIMRNESFTERIILYNDLYRTEAEKRPGVTFISSFELFQDENGEYATYLRDANGVLQLVRAPDGAHFTWPGAYRLSAHVLRVIAEDWGFADRLG